MAVQRNDAESKLIIRVGTGTTVNGATVYSPRTFTRINPALGDADVLEIGSALGALQVYPVGSVNRQDAAKLEAIA